MNDDYGDGRISKLFYDGVIPEEQLAIAQETRKLVLKLVGATYADFRLALTHPDKVEPEIVKYAKNLGALAIQLQWVEGDARKAESSFFKINQQAAPIDKTELKLLESRRKPNSIAARAIIRSGKGHKYWSLFSTESQSEIQNLAAEINETLFAPKLQTPIKTLDLPVGGKLYGSQTLPLILDFINIVNKLDPNNKGIIDDYTGDTTIKILKDVRRITYRLNSNHPSSLGLHPAVYFYSQEGRHKPASFFAVVDFVMELEKRKKINDFIDVRVMFEKFIVEYDYLIQQIYRKYRSAQKSYSHISGLFLKVVSAFKTGKTIEAAIGEVASSPDFSYLALQNIPQQTDSVSRNFNTSQKSAIYIREALQNAPKCKICGGLIHRNSISIDHLQRKQDGGLATLENGQLTHPYCNTGYKN